MLVTGLFHCAIKTNDLKATVGFYTRVLGLREVTRPDFGYPGAWLACPAPGGDAIVHIYAGGPALGREGKAPSGTGAIDHLSLAAHGFHEFRERFRAADLDWREVLVPGTTLLQGVINDNNWNTAGYRSLQTLKQSAMHNPGSPNVKATDNIDAMVGDAGVGFRPILGHSGRSLSAAELLVPKWEKTLF